MLKNTDLKRNFVSGFARSDINLVILNKNSHVIANKMVIRCPTSKHNSFYHNFIPKILTYNFKSTNFNVGNFSVIN